MDKNTSGRGLQYQFDIDLETTMDFYKVKTL